MNGLLKSFTATNFMWGLALGALSLVLFPVIKDSMKPVLAGAANSSGMAAMFNNGETAANDTMGNNYSFLADELRKQREYTTQQINEITQQLANLQKQIDTLKA